MIAIIQQMVRQEPYLEYLLTTPMPVPTACLAVPDGSLYRQQVRTAMELGAQQRSHKEFERRLLAIKAIADDFYRAAAIRGRLDGLRGKQYVI